MIIRILPILALLFVVKIASAQKVDTVINNLPIVNDKIIYNGEREIKGRDKATLDSIAKKWFISYFTLNQLSADKATSVGMESDTAGVLLNRAFIEYKVRPGWVDIPFILIARVKVSVWDGHYSYTIDDIHFRPKNNTLAGIGYQNDPDYLAKTYKRKHLGLATAWVVTRKQIREYLGTMNKTVRGCITSLNNAMAN